MGTFTLSNIIAKKISDKWIVPKGATPEEKSIEVTAEIRGKEYTADQLDTKATQQKINEIKSSADMDRLKQIFAGVSSIDETIKQNIKEDLLRQDKKIMKELEDIEATVRFGIQRNIRKQEKEFIDNVYKQEMQKYVSTKRPEILSIENQINKIENMSWLTPQEKENRKKPLIQRLINLTGVNPKDEAQDYRNKVNNNIKLYDRLPDLNESSIDEFNDKQYNDIMKNRK